MKKEIAMRWVEALRSGEYKQRKGYLKKNDKFCCLGVLCDLHAKETNTEWDESQPGTFYYHSDFAVPSSIVTDWAGMKNCSPETKGVSIIQLNDDQNKSFEEIANIIEANYESF